MRVYRTSVKEDINVGNVFQHLAENYVQRIRMEQDFLRFDIGGPKSLSIQINSGNHVVDRVCNGSTSSNSSSSSDSSTGIFSKRKFSSNASSGYFSLTNFGAVNEDSGNDRHGLMSFTPQSHYTTPQEYLNNPMFESLNNHKRLAWPSVIGGSGSDRTITLKPLNVLKRKKSKSSLQKRLGFGSHTATNNVVTTNYQYPPPPPLTGRSNACKVL